MSSGMPKINCTCPPHIEAPFSEDCPIHGPIAASRKNAPTVPPPNVEQQPMPKAGQVSVTRTIIRRLEDRERLGIQKYGRTLETFNGRDSILDHQEELLDALQYSEQWRLERNALIEENARCKELVKSTVEQSESLIQQNERLRGELIDARAEIDRLQKIIERNPC